MKKLLFLFSCLSLAFLMTNCIGVATIRGGEVGVKRRVGKIQGDVIQPGLTVYSPFVSTIFRLSTTTTNRKVNLNIPSKEGLTIAAEMSILYRIVPEKAPEIVQTIGLNFEEVVIMPVFRSSLANTSAKFYAKDMHSGKRAEIEKSVAEQMTTELEGRGFIIESVLMKRIVLPSGLSKAIENKLKAEQDAQQMEFTLLKEQKEAERNIIEADGRKKVAVIAAKAESERKIIDAEADKQSAILRAEGQKKANDLVAAGLTDKLLKNKAIEAFEMLSTSDNAKTIITDSKGQILNIGE